VEWYVVVVGVVAGVILLAAVEWVLARGRRAKAGDFKVAPPVRTTRWF